MTDPILMDVEKIKTFIPQRHPLLLIDCVHEMEPFHRIVTSKFLSPDEPVFAGHFPGNPVYPGVYYLESMAQTGAVLLFASSPDRIGHLGLLSGVDEARFRRPCQPGDRVKFEVSVEKTRGIFFWLKGKAYVGDEIVAEARLSVALTKQRIETKP